MDGLIEKWYGESGCGWVRWLFQMLHRHGEFRYLRSVWHLAAEELFRGNEADVWTAPCNWKCGVEYCGWLDPAESQHERTGSMCLSWCRWAVPDSWCTTGNLSVVPTWKSLWWQGRFLYFLQTGECAKKNLAKIKVKSGLICDALRKPRICHSMACIDPHSRTEDGGT